MVGIIDSLPLGEGMPRSHVPHLDSPILANSKLELDVAQNPLPTRGVTGLLTIP